MTAIPSYAVGTVSIDAGATVVVGAGGPLWTSTTNARPGDDLVVAGHIVIVEDVIDDTHLEIDAWPFAAVPAGAPYKIVQRSPLRFAGAEASADVIKLVGALNTEGLPFIVPPGVAAPDPTLGEENQFAIQPSTFKLWLKTGGAWVFQGLYKGLNVRGAWDAAATYGANDIVLRNGSSYVATGPSTNNPPESSPMVWQLLASKGDKGDKGDVGSGYAATSATSVLIGNGSKTFVTQEGLAYSAGVRARASSSVNGANYMEGLVTAYTGGSLTITVSKTGGSGTFADWNINVAGDPGSGDMLSTNNLSDLANKKTAMDNLSVHGSDIAAAATVNLEGATGNFVHITGSTGVSAITLSEGHQRTVLFTGAPLLTNSSSLVLPGGANIQVVAGDIAVFLGDASGVVRCTEYLKASGGTITAASKSDQQTATSGVLPVTPLHQQDHPSAAKAWVKFNGVGAVTVQASYNIGAVTRAGGGNYSIPFITPFASADYVVAYAVLFQTAGRAQFMRIGVMTTSGIAITTLDNTFNPSDTDGIMLVFFGTQ